MTTILGIWGICLAAFFIFCLALCRAAKQPIPGLRHPRPAVLVMDDNASVLGMVRMGLENEGYTVLTASDPCEGLQLFKEQSQNISLVLLNNCMTEMPGSQVFESLWRIDREVPVLLLANFCKKNERAKEFHENVRGCLLMPFRMDELIGKVREVVSLV